MVYDVISYNNERDLFDIRYEILKYVVDEFVVVQSPTTFSGMPREIAPIDLPKVRNVVNDERYSDELIAQARQSRYTNGEERWMREWMQKEVLQEAMRHLHDDDIVYIGDCDEIWEHREPNGIEKLKLRVYAYWLNFRSTEQFWGTVRCKYRDIKDRCLNDVRNDISYRTGDYQGWHFTNTGGQDALKKKIEDQYNAELFNDHLINDVLPRNYGTRDFIGRDFLFEKDESDWPPYLKANKESYKNLCKTF